MAPKPILGLVLTVGILAGCGNPAAQQQLSRRSEHLQNTVNLLDKQEAAGPAKLDQTINTLRRRHEHDVTRSRENQDRLERWPQEEFNRWEKEEPNNRRIIEDQIKGNPNNIEPTAIKMLY